MGVLYYEEILMLVVVIVMVNGLELEEWLEDDLLAWGFQLSIIGL